jgi:glucosamine-6-phosphate deaminase
MKVLMLPSPERAAKRAAGLVADAIGVKDRPVLGLVTGSTLEQVYADLVARHRAGALSFLNTTTFNLDEYVGLSPDHPQSYRQKMETLFFSHGELDSNACDLLLGDAPDPCAEAERYEAAIAIDGGIDLQLLGIGQNGHIGFNEATSSLGARTRIKTLTCSTRKTSARFFDHPGEVPCFAITMGIATNLDARRVFPLVTGASEVEALARVIEGPLCADLPATALQMHPKANVIVDRDAAAELRMINYYQEIHPDGEEPKIG